MSQLQNTPPTADPPPDLFIELSDPEQETISAGFGLTYLFFEQEIISSSSSNTTEIDNLSLSSGSGRTSQQANYDAKRTTFAFGGLIPISSVSSFIASILKLF
ncbi:hypothetical protein HRE53_06685 [Acaryochloris sp. 'Moss Beach']|uniref:hypothetical protein n=1 Tax=Acaryochloris sp. 'Moss Beach' TaxID=2740837 RepID=UPI001F335166|nr:hypothetical protein [Acaryochloris sp. 'Moss Beach']UJB70736.1 hypothetical protein HRE53_06685 [Acaryochloris sp. 'Moss Beach']